jgi:hypothetical protein
MFPSPRVAADRLSPAAPRSTDGHAASFFCRHLSVFRLAALLHGDDGPQISLIAQILLTSTTIDQPCESAKSAQSGASGKPGESC